MAQYSMGDLLGNKFGNRMGGRQMPAWASTYTPSKGDPNQMGPFGMSGDPNSMNTMLALDGLAEKRYRPSRPQQNWSPDAMPMEQPPAGFTPYQDNEPFPDNFVPQEDPTMPSFQGMPDRFGGEGEYMSSTPSPAMGSSMPTKRPMSGGIADMLRALMMQRQGETY